MPSYLHFFLFLILFTRFVAAHPADTSQLRVKLGHQQVEFRFTLNLLSLSRIAVLDTDHDQRITATELAASAPTLAAFLKQHVLVTINDEDADIGSFGSYEAMWPNPSVEPVTDRDASQRFVDFHFTKPWPKGVREVWIGFQIFGQLGDQHTVMAIYQQPGEPDEAVTFTQGEPEYLFDTGWTEKDKLEQKPVQPSAPAPRSSVAMLNQIMFAGMLLLAGGGLWLAWRRR